MVEFNWGGAASTSSSGGGYPVQHWWDQTPSGGSGGSVTEIGSQGAAPAPAPTNVGGFSLDLTSPGAFGSSLSKSISGSQTFVDALGQGLFGKQGSVLGGVPVLGDLGRFLGDNPLGQYVGNVIRSGINLAGNVAERIPTGTDLAPRYQQLPVDLRSAYDKEIAADPGRTQHFMYQALQEQARTNQQTTPDLFWDMHVPGGSLADSVSNILGLWTFFGRRLQRGVAGLSSEPGTFGKVSGLDRLGEIEQLVDNGIEPNPVEKIAYANWKAEVWRKDQALDFLASNSAGFFHDPKLQAISEFFLDPAMFGALGASGLSRIGIKADAAFKLAPEVERLKAAGSSGRFDLLGKLAEQPGTMDFMRWYGAHVYTPLETSQLGKVAKLARTAIDPLHAIGQNRVHSEALVDVLTETATRAMRQSVGAENPLAVLRWADGLGNGFQDRLLAGEANYVTNVARGTIQTGQRDAAVSRGVAEQLKSIPPPHMLDALLAEPAPKDLGILLRNEMDRVTPPLLTEPQLQDLAVSLSRLHGTRSADQMLADLKKMNPGELAYLHGVVYGVDVNTWLKAKQAALSLPYDGRTPLRRLNLMNQSTLGETDLKTLMEQLGATTDFKESMRLLTEAQKQFPALAYLDLSKITGKGKQAKLERVIASLQKKLEDGGLPMKLTPDELQAMPAPIREWAEAHPTRSVGFEPPDDLKWGLDQDPLTGKWYGSHEPWNDLVAHEGAVYRPVSSMFYNAAGMPLLGPVMRKAGRGVDALEAARETWGHAISTQMYLANAQNRLTRLAVEGKGKAGSPWAIKGGATPAEARKMFQDLMEVSRLDRHTIRGLREGTLWDKMETLIPKRLRYQEGWVSRDLINLVLSSFEGDFRVVGMTQKFTGRAKTILAPLGGNATGYIAEHLYPDIKFGLNAIFQAQEKVEAPTWLITRGVTPILGSKMTEVDRTVARVFDQAATTSVARAADTAEMVEYTTNVLWGGRDAARRIVANGGDRLRNVINRLTDVGGQRVVSKLRAEQAQLGRPIREAMEQYWPDEWRRIADQYSIVAGHMLSDNEIALQWLAEGSLANKVHVANYVTPGMSYADFTNAIISQPWLPANIGEIKTLNLDWLTDMLEMPIGPNEYAKTPTQLAAALRRGDVQWEDVADVMARHGMPPEYISRVKRAFEFNWDNFWGEVKSKFDATPGEIKALQSFIEQMAKSQGASPVEYLSQILRPEVGESARGVIVGDLGDTLAFLRAPAEGGTADDLVDQLTRILNVHLHPSGRAALEEAFGRSAGTLGDAVVERIRSGVPNPNPEVERLFRQFGAWSESAIADGLLAGNARARVLLGDVMGLPRAGATPFNMSQQLVVAKAEEGLRLASNDAFRLLYYKQNRTLLERSLNHPFFALYPLSYMWGKVLPEMVRFIAKEPFGIQTGAVAYGLNAVSLSVAAQREWDPAFDAMMDKIGRSDALFWLGYILPSVPWDVSIGTPVWARDIAQQSIANQRRVDRGLAPKPIDLARTAEKVGAYVSLGRGWEQFFKAAASVDDLFTQEQKPVVASSPPVAPEITALEQQLRQNFVDLRQQLR